MMRRTYQDLRSVRQAAKIRDLIDHLCARNWTECRQAAIEAAGGIGWAGNL